MLLLLATACTASEVEPNARIDITGLARRESGMPAGGVRVALSREADFVEAFAVFTTLGFACLDRQLCEDARVVRADAEGGYAFRLTGRDTQGAGGSASTMVLSSQLPPNDVEQDGPNATYRFLVQTEKLDLPIGFWEPRLAGATGSFGARVTWTRIPARVLPAPLRAASFENAIVFLQGDDVVWRQDRARSGVAFDARVLEDTSGSAAVFAETEDEPVTDELGRRLTLALRSGARPYESPAGAPPSRGAACSLLDTKGKLVPQSPCPFTDGDLAEEIPASSNSVVVELGARHELTLIVVRGCSDRCTVETSRDGKRWRTAGVAASEHAALRVSPAVAARFVRVNGSLLSDLREISAWTGGPGVPAGPLFVEPGTVEPGAPGARAAADEDKSSNVLRIVAVAVLSAVGGALVAILISRRRRRASRP